MGFYTEAGLARIARLVFNARRKRNMSLRKFAELCEVDQSYLSRLELQEIGEPSNEYLGKIAPHLGISTLELILIGSEQQAPGKARTAKEALPQLEDLPVEELLQLRNFINERLAGIESLERGIEQPPT